jgi:hypothetical protein
MKFAGKVSIAVLGLFVLALAVVAGFAKAEPFTETRSPAISDTQVTASDYDLIEVTRSQPRGASSDKIEFVRTQPRSTSGVQAVSASGIDWTDVAIGIGIGAGAALLVAMSLYVVRHPPGRHPPTGHVAAH